MAETAVKKPMAQTAQQNSADEPTFIPAEYNEVVKKADLVAVDLSDLRFSVKPDFFLKEIEKSIDLKKNFNFRLLGNHFVAKSGISVSQFQWFVEVLFGRKSLVKITADYHVVYRGLDGCNEYAVKEFAVRIGRTSSYPYFRALVSQLTWSAGVSLPILPVIGTNVPVALGEKPRRKPAARKAKAD